MSRRFHRACASLLLAATLLAQEPTAPTFDSSAKLVLVPFHVQRGKYFAADLQPSDVALREDGHPRQFTTFEGPNTEHPLPLELILLFDTTPRTTATKGGFPEPSWTLDPKADYEFIGNWNESITRDVLQKNGMDIRIAVYHFSGNQLKRLCAATSDPSEIAHALNALLNPIPAGKGEQTLLPGDKIFKSLFGTSPRGWLNESVVSALKDTAASPAPARRLLIVFTDGSSGTNSKSMDTYGSIVDPALAMNIPINPVIMDIYKQQQHVMGSAAGPGGALATTDAPKRPADTPLNESPVTSSLRYTGLLPWFANTAEMTGGEKFVPQHLNRETLAGILALVRDSALSQYVVGFSPDASPKPKKHSLNVTLTSKTTGKLVGGEKNGVTY